MAEVIPHFCTGTGCEALHGGSRESEAVKIARINRDADVEIAKLARAETREYTEAATEQTAIEADAAVEQTTIEAEAIVEIGAPPEEEPEVPVVEAPVIVEAPEESGEEVAAPPETESAPADSGGGGFWDKYR